MFAFLLDENTAGWVASAFRRRWHAGTEPRLDVVRVGDFDAPPYGTQDPELLIWAEEYGRVLLTEDRNTMPTFLERHLEAGRSSPGVLILRAGMTVPELVRELELTAVAGHADDFRDQVRYIPL